MNKKIEYKKNKSINILFTSVGNKVSLVESFRDVYIRLGIVGKTVGIDSDPYSAGLYIVDKGYAVPMIDSPNFFKRIIEICRRDSISVIIPTRDEDLLYFSQNIGKFEEIGVKIIVSPYDSIATCADKWKFYQYLNNIGIPTMKTWEYSSGDIKFPCIIKPKQGKGGIGARVIKTQDDLSEVDLKNMIVQEMVDGVEYTIDYFADFDTKPICVIPRIRLKITDGESKIGITKNEKKMISLAKKLARSLRLIGHNTIQCFKLKNGDIQFLEINPRFGGGASLGMAAGCKSPEYILSLLMGIKVKPQRKFTENLVMIRHSRDIFIPYDKISRI